MYSFQAVYYSNQPINNSVRLYQVYYLHHLSTADSNSTHASPSSVKALLTLFLLALTFALQSETQGPTGIIWISNGQNVRTVLSGYFSKIVLAQTCILSYRTARLGTIQHV